jgi:hypothetical protein
MCNPKVPTANNAKVSPVENFLEERFKNRNRFCSALSESKILSELVINLQFTYDF